MKSLVITLSLVLAFATTVAAQKKKISRYETFIYTSDKIDVLIQNEYTKEKAGTRGFMSNLSLAALNAGKGIAGGYVTSLIDFGIGTVASLITKNANDKLKWEELVKLEDVYLETLSTVEPINNFYSRSSFDGAMDPAGMNFNGIGCLRTVDGDTVFYVSCHIDQSKISRIINHSKFELSLDTLVVAPAQLDLPNSNFNKAFSFDERKDFQITVQMRIVSSWMNVLTEMQKNQELGSFVLNVPVNRKNLDGNGKLRYVRAAGTPEEYKITGESFIIPRSFMGYRDENNTYKDSWGTGDYRIELSLKETCDITDAYRKNWKADWKQRQDAENDENFMQKTWKTVTAQRWDALGKQWVITTLKAPADVLNSELLDILNLTATKPAQTGKK